MEPLQLLSSGKRFQTADHLRGGRPRLPLSLLRLRERILICESRRWRRLEEQVGVSLSPPALLTLSDGVCRGTGC